MKLCESTEFEQAILAAVDHFRELGISEQVVEKDYYVTEALRIIASAFGDRIIFKGGTSPTWDEIEACFAKLRPLL